MRRFAEIDSNGLVLRVIVADSGKWCADTLGGKWVETFKDRSHRAHFASPGFTYDETLDVFIPPKPFDSWVLTDSYEWKPPTPAPDMEFDEDGNVTKAYVWDESAGEWVVAE